MKVVRKPITDAESLTQQMINLQPFPSRRVGLSLTVLVYSWLNLLPPEPL